MNLLLTRRAALLGAMSLTSACRGPEEASAPPSGAAPPAAGQDPLDWAVNGPWRATDRARDRWRHPAETLRFFGLRPAQTVVEMWPGAGWYTRVLAPYLTRTNGVLYAAMVQASESPSPADDAAQAAYRDALTADPATYGQVRFTSFGPGPAPIAPPASADLVLFLRNLHGWMAAGLAEKAFRDAFAALKRGGRLGVEQHRAAPGQAQDPAAASGYVQEPYVRRLAGEAGFIFEAASEINANGRDDHDHPFGVWTLPPVRRSSEPGQLPNPRFDHRPFDAVGESDRMTLRFRKPV